MTSRFNLPELDILSKDPAEIELSILNTIQEETNITLENADPRRQWVKALTAYVSMERNNLEHRIKQNLLSYAEESALDHIGITNDTARLEAKSAKTSMEIVFETGRVADVLIESGTLFLVGENTYFQTLRTEVAVIGTHRIEIEVECTEAGVIGNDYLPGQISTLVRPMPWVISVSNTKSSGGGTDRETDDAYAERIRLAEEKYATAGPELAYVYHAKSANASIVDVSVDTPSPNEVTIAILLQDGQIPSQQILDDVEAAVNGKTIRPLTDTVTASAPNIVSYDAEAMYWIDRKQATLLSQIQTNVEAAYNDVLVWQRSKMGRDVDLSELIRRLKNAGAARVSVSGQMFVSIEKAQVAVENGYGLTFGGLTDV